MILGEAKEFEVRVFKTQDDLNLNSNFDDLVKQGNAFIMPKTNGVLINRQIFRSTKFFNSQILCVDPMGEHKRETPDDGGVIFIDKVFESAEEVSKIFKNYERFSTDGYHIFFYNCEFKFPEEIAYNPIETRVTYNWYNCKINNISINHFRNRRNIEESKAIKKANDLDNKFNNCTINTFKFETDLLPASPFYLSCNTVDIISTNALTIRLKKLTTKLIHHQELHKKPDFGFDNVNILYDKKLLTELDTDEGRGYLNSFRQFYLNDGLYSEHDSIERYINYFSSKDNGLYRLLFIFNDGNKKILIPMISTFVMVCGMIHITTKYFDVMDLVSAFYPIEMFKEVLLADKVITEKGLLKLLLLIFEIVYIYSAFSMIAAIKKRFGFKISR